MSEQFRRVRGACEKLGREPDDVVWSNALVVCCGRDEAEVRRRADAIGRDADELRANGAAGTPSEVVDTLSRYAAAGSQRVYLQVLDLSDLDHLDLIAAQVLPSVVRP
jgi:alkanesulfonate monooxygenase SsuD/methylene tetrahydromethanopterin reductase-like flavin-dependent oxidoreductase (luciferase family)